ncbi:unnamed protein product [Polarella glacialis]|uniref:Actin-related protein 10 n=1 Tax=Polarella glacialis TaxID=89957 RepID=A0A813F4N8_POLGL|nr:unnamed protein product [Polarella glacialis]
MAVPSVAPLLPASVRQVVEKMLSEDLGFAEVLCLPAPALALRSQRVAPEEQATRRSTCTVLDLGFSACFAQPCVDGVAIESAGRRLNVGARVLTNLLLERLRLRHYDLSAAWLLVEDILAKTGEVASNFDKVLHAGYSTSESKTYVLPDFKAHNRGFVRADPSEASETGLQEIKLLAERLAVPEALFRPQDFGIPMSGLPELVHQAILAVSEEKWRPHLGRVLLCGGLARLPGLAKRLRLELRQLLPSHWPVEVIVEDEPELAAWRGAAQLVADGLLSGTVSKLQLRRQRQPQVAKPDEVDLGRIKSEGPKRKAVCLD